MTRCMVRIVAVFVALTSAALAQDRVRYDGDRLVMVTLRSEADLKAMLDVSGDCWACHYHLGEMPFRVPLDRMDELEASGLAYRVISENVQALIDAESASIPRGPGWFDAYHDYPATVAYLDSLVALRPDLATRINLGLSLESRQIVGMRITGLNGPAGKPALFFEGCQHAREWVAVKVPMYIADQLIRNYGTDERATALLDTYVVYVVPIVNPDGYQYTWTNTRLWRKNRRNNGGGSFGVDLNRNWGEGWGLDSGSSSNTSSETYRGTAAFSEPETQVMRDFIAAHPEIVAAIDFHSYSELILSPWSYNTGEPPEPDATTFDQLNGVLQGSIASVHNHTYIAGPGGATLYLASGTMPDWTYGQRGAYAWTIELRPVDAQVGFLLPPEEILPTAQENYEGILALSESLSSGLSFAFPLGLPATVPSGVPSNLRVDVIALIGDVSDTRVYRRAVPGGGFVAVDLTSLGGNQYEALLPPRACGVTWEYYFEARNEAGDLVRSPADAPASVYSTIVQNSATLFSDDMEIDRGWAGSVPSDNASSGRWNRMDPQATAAQPGDDHTASGTICWVTDGNAGTSVGAFDVDNGTTTLVSPLIDLSGATDPTIRYWRWYSNTAGSAPNADVFVVRASFNGGSYVDIETVGPTGAETSGGWFEHAFRVRDFTATLGNARMQFIASDLNAGSIVEAAVDDFLVEDVGCADAFCMGDVNGDRTRDLTDLAMLLSAFGTCAGDAAFLWQTDLNADDCVGLTDLASLLSVFGENCP